MSFFPTFTWFNSPFYWLVFIVGWLSLLIIRNQIKLLAVSKNISHFKPAHGFKWQLQFTRSSIMMKPPQMGTVPLALQSRKRISGHALFALDHSLLDYVCLAYAAWLDQASICQVESPCYPNLSPRNNVITSNLQVMKKISSLKQLNKKVHLSIVGYRDWESCRRSIYLSAFCYSSFWLLLCHSASLFLLRGVEDDRQK